MVIKFEGEVLRLGLLNTLLDSREMFCVSTSDSVITIVYAKSGGLNEELKKSSQDTFSPKSNVFITKE